MNQSMTEQSTAQQSFTDKQGQAVPAAEVWLIDERGESRKVDATSLFEGRRVALFALPGAFTPTCSNMHVPRFNQLAEDFLDNGVEAIYCLAVNDPFVMQAWKNDQHAEHIQFISDPDAIFTEGMGMLVDHSKEGLGKRSWRYSMVVDNGNIEKMFIEPTDSGKDDPFVVSDADTLLSYLNPETEALKPITMFARHGCPFCAHAQDLLDKANLGYEVIWLSDEISLDSVRAVTRRATVPQVFIDGQHIGGSEDLETYLEQRQGQ